MNNWMSNSQDASADRSSAGAEDMLLNLTILGDRQDLIDLLEEMARVKGFTVVDGSFSPVKVLKPGQRNITV